MGNLLRVTMSILVSMILVSCSPPKTGRKSKDSGKEKSESVAKRDSQVAKAVDELIASKGNMDQSYNARFAKDDSKIPILVWAAEHNDVVSVKLLLENGADPNITVLKRATNTVLFTICKGTEWDTEKDEKRFHARKNSHEICSLLIRAGADVNHANKIGETPLMKAALRGREDLCILMISAGASVNARGPLGRTALHSAAKQGYWNVVKLLVEKGARAEIKDQMHLAALDLAQKRSDEDLYNKIRETLPCAYKNADYDKTISFLEGIRLR